MKLNFNSPILFAPWGVLGVVGCIFLHCMFQDIQDNKWQKIGIIAAIAMVWGSRFTSSSFVCILTMPFIVLLLVKVRTINLYKSATGISALYRYYRHPAAWIGL